jgi:tRNA-uridine 2-sulfurtransferase
MSMTLPLIPSPRGDKRTRKVVVGLSGGVDSSVAAWLLQQQGYQVEGLFMKNWEEEDNDHFCSAAADRADAQAVCDALGIPLHTVNFSAEYWDEVFEHFLAGYRAGQTPNPDILCNQAIKFTAFLQFAKTQLKAEAIATGHYARRALIGGQQQLWRGLDPQKDQSYFLYTLNQQQLAYSLFPLGKLSKIDVRRIARHLGLVTADKKDSTGICFIGPKRFREFLARYLPPQPGLIQSTEGVILGEHAGLFYYTLGQRQGLGIGGTNPQQTQAWYVVAKDQARNLLIVGQGHDHPQQQALGLRAEQLCWVDQQRPTRPLRCTAKIRYRQPDVACTLIPLPAEAIQVQFEKPQFAITPGQAVVFYQGECCLGGATIAEALPLTGENSTLD